MNGNNLKKLKSENGMVIVEATFVFPVMFFILFFLIYMGNAHFEKSQIESIVVQRAIEGAGYCADPILETIKQTGSIPDVKDADLDLKPYRYLFGGNDEIENDIEGKVVTDIENKSMTFFSGMHPTVKTKEAKYDNKILYATFSVDVEYDIKFPIRFLGADSPTVLTIKTRSEVPVGDAAEFIRNTDMAIHMLEDTKLGQSISGAFEKVNSFLNQFASK